MITSSHNPKIQAVRQLLARRKDRRQSASFVVEGVRLCEEALGSGWQPMEVFYSENISARGRALVEEQQKRGVDVEEVLPSVLASLSDTETSPGLLAMIAERELPLPPELDFVLVADALRDPGNLGTILRSAAAAGVQAAFLAPGTVDAFSPKVLRAGMGAQFRLPLRTLSWEQIVAICKQPARPLALFLAEAGQGVPLWQADLRQSLALVVGGEAEGASAEGRAAADQLLSIPMPGQSESLNAAVAAGILLFEVVRQRLT